MKNRKLANFNLKNWSIALKFINKTILQRNKLKAILIIIYRNIILLTITILLNIFKIMELWQAPFFMNNLVFYKFQKILLMNVYN